MKDGVLILMMILIAVGGVFLMRSVDGYFSGKRRRAVARKKENRYRIRLAAEREELLRAVEPTMEYYMDQSPHIKFTVGEGRIPSMVRRLYRGQLDVVLLTEDSFEKLHWEGEFVRFPHRREDDPSEGEWLYALWNPRIVSKRRDRFLHGLEQGYQILTCGYRNY